uniref:Alcohol dehydrogenase 5 n=1 Tax=Hucho hucho TaxID=62062 RepID=A0A4W5PF24_9TELE
MRGKLATAGKVSAGKPLSIEEMRIKIKVTRSCTIAWNHCGLNPEGVFSVVLGHEGAGTMESEAREFTLTKISPIRDTVILLYLPQCGECKFCKNHTTNLVKSSGECSGHSQQNQRQPLGCGISTGYGAAINIAKTGSTCAVLGLAVIKGCKAAEATRIIGIDLNTIRWPRSLDYSFICREALKACHKGWVTSVIIGVAAGQTWTGTGMDLTCVPKLVSEYMNNKLKVDDSDPHTLPFEKIRGLQYNACWEMLSHCTKITTKNNRHAA